MNVENLVSEVVVLVGNFLGSLVGFGGAGCMTNLSGSYRYYLHGRLAYHNCDSKFDNLILIVSCHIMPTIIMRHPKIVVRLLPYYWHFVKFGLGLRATKLTRGSEDH